MPAPAYVLDCPNCGAQLSYHVGPAQDTPWLCNACRTGWWVAELAPAARLAWRPQYRDHLGTDRDTVIALDLARHVERDEAIARGISARADHIGLLSHADLVALRVFLTTLAANRPAAVALLALVNTALANRGD